MEDDIRESARQFAQVLDPSAEGAVVVALSGDLGAGKTTFAREVLRTLGIAEHVTSPTFVIEKIYRPTQGPFERVVHIDAYRLKGPDELQVIGWDELIANPKTLILIEWPENVLEAIPKEAQWVTLDIEGEGRSITYGRKER